MPSIHYFLEKIDNSATETEVGEAMIEAIHHYDIARKINAKTAFLDLGCLIDRVHNVNVLIPHAMNKITALAARVKLGASVDGRIPIVGKVN